MKPAAAAVQPRLRLLPTLAALAVVIATLLLGRWQLHRADEKIALRDALLARASEPAVDLADPAVQGLPVAGLRFRRAHAQGVYRPQGQIYIDNRDRDGVFGYYVLTPLDLGARVVLVNRGFLARSPAYPQPPVVPVPVGDQTVQGVLTPGGTRFLELSADTIQGAVWQNLKLDRYAELTGLQPLPVVLNADPAGPGLLPVTEQPETGIDMHRGYAFQWFALCLGAAGLYLYFTFFRKGRSVP